MVYAPQLSYATISNINVNKILNKGYTLISKHQLAALQSSQRTNSTIFINDVKNFNKLIKDYDNMWALVDAYSSKGNSIFKKIYGVAETMRDIFELDAKTMFSEIPMYKAVYEKYYMEPIFLLTKHQEELHLAIQEVANGLRLGKYLSIPENGLYQLL